MSRPLSFPAVFVLFGVTGDLANRKLLPALYELVKNNQLHKQTYIIGTSRRPIDASHVIEKLAAWAQANDKTYDSSSIEKVRAMLRIVQLDPEEKHDFSSLKDTIMQLEREASHPLEHLFYLSVPPRAYLSIIQNLAAYELNGSSSKLLVEKPFGHDLASATKLISDTNQFFSEEQIYRTDHYLAKETAQNILVFRQKNPLFRALWNSRHITDIHIRAFENITIEGRVDFYEPIGALRDFVQSHLLQLLALVTIPDPDYINDSVRLHQAKTTLLEHTWPILDDQARPLIRGQYRGYTDETNNPDSNTETFAHIPLQIDTEQWRNTNIYLSTGKAMDKKRTEIVLYFTDPRNTTEKNILTFQIQPEEAITLKLRAKRPGFEDKTESVDMNFDYHHAFTDQKPPEAYERVLLDALHGDHTLFITSAEVLTCWRILAPIQALWDEQNVPLVIYDKNSTADQIITQ